MLTQLNNQNPLPNTAITLEFVDETGAAGSSGCNNYSTTYEVDGIRISFGQTAGTLMACVPPVMAQEQSYLQALADAAFFEVSDEKLQLFDSNTTLLAEFEPASNELAGSSWDVISYNNGKEAVVTVKIGTSITAVFDEDGQVSGSAGCNNYFGSYTTDGNAIKIGPLASTRKMCADPEVMDQEAAYLTALETAATFKITGNRMEMRTEDGALVGTFSRMEGAE
jgi:heat shock protein HslJ